MSDHRTHARLDIWIAQHLDGLTEDIRDALDIEAGLRDARLPDRTQSLDASLNAALDIDAGLKAITRVRNGRSQHELPAREPALASTPLERFVRDLTQRPLREQLMLRSQLPLEDLRLINRLVVARRTVTVVVSDLDHALGRDRAIVNTLSDIADHDQRTVADRTREAAHALTHAVDRALIRVSGIDRGLVNLLGSIEMLDSVMGRVLHLNVTLNRALARSSRPTRDCADALNSAHKTARKIDGEINNVINRVHKIARNIDGDINNAANRARDIARELNAPDLARAVDNAVDNAGHLTAGIRALELAVTDFTTADLADLDLHGLDLRGMHWSILTTRWPEDWLTPILEASAQVDPTRRPELYEVRDDPRIPQTVH